MSDTRNPKEIFSQKLLSALQEFEQTTGVEVHNIDFPNRLNDNDIGDSGAYERTVLTTMRFTLK